MTLFDHDTEEDEGYLAAVNGLSLSENPYPRGTIRYQHWRSGWHIRRAETFKNEDEGYQAACNGLSLSENPHPRGTIRYQQWRSSWQLKQAEIQRSIRLATRHVAV
jgi:ribosome modulation factor